MSLTAESATMPIVSEGDIEEDEDNSEFQLSMEVRSTVSLSITLPVGMNYAGEPWLLCTSSSTTTTTMTTTTTTTETVGVDSVRDAVNEQLVQGCLAGHQRSLTQADGETSSSSAPSSPGGDRGRGGTSLAASITAN